MRHVAILGSTGSIGQSTLAVVRSHADRLKVVGLAAGRNAGRLAEQVARFGPRVVGMASEASLADLERALAAAHIEPPETLAVGDEGLVAVATHPDVDVVLVASSGTAALEAVLAAISCGKTIALANKEVLVMAGSLVMAAAARHGVDILPVDSEHNAIHQCLHGRSPAEVERLVLTASGGPFRDMSPEGLQTVSPEDALRHPTWNMGPKITIDSATLMNKGLEVIEARWLFDVPPERIDVVVHPQSIVHSMVRLCDGSLIAQLGVTDMRLPIQYALSYPARWASSLPALDLVRSCPLDFHLPDRERFPCLDLAYRALRGDGLLPAVMNGANETAVAAFLDGRLPFGAIPVVVEQTMDAHQADASSPEPTLTDIRHVDRWAREHASSLLEGWGGLELKERVVL